MESGCYVQDLYDRQLHHAVLIRSPVARGQLVAIKPPKLPQSVSLITAKDIPGTNGIVGANGLLPLLASTSVEYIGQPVGILVGPDLSALDRFAAECVVEVTPQKPLLNFEKFSSEQLVEKRTAVIGDPDEAFKRAEHVVEASYRTGAQEHWYAETQSALARFSYDKMLVSVSTQWPYHVRQTVADVLDVRTEDVVVEPCAIGVHLDGKIFFPSMMASWAALAALHCRKSVKMQFTREEDVLYTPKRPSTIVRLRSAIGKNGELLAMESKSVLEMGASSLFAGECLDRLCLGSLGSYRCPNVRLEGFAVRTNTPPTGPFAGFGLSPAFFAIEQHVSKIAVSS